MWLIRAISNVLFGSVISYQQSILDANRNFVKSFESDIFSYKNDSFAYISKFEVFDESCYECDALVQLFPGAFVSGSRYDHTPVMQYLSFTRKVQPWSIDYRLIDEGTSYDHIVSDVRIAMTMLRQKVGPTKKIVVVGSSAGGDLAQRVSSIVDGCHP